MSQILLHNFPSHHNQSEININFSCPTCGKVKCKHKIDLILGFQKFDLASRKIELIKDFINALLLNEQIYIYAFDLFFLIDCFKTTEIRKLVELDILKVIYSNTAEPYLTGSNGILNLKYGKCASFEKFTNSIEAKLAKKSHNNQINQAENDILARIESQPTILDEEILKNRISKETSLDLKNQNITKTKLIKSNDISKVRYQDAINILSLAHSNKAMIIGAELNLSNIKLDDDAKANMNSKFGPTFFRKVFKGESQVEVFEELNDLKGVPNFGELYTKGIISLDDILSIRNSVDGKVFRIWYESQDYNKELTLKKIINSVDSPLQGVITKHFRWIIPVAAGIINPVAGVTSSYANSFIVDKLLSGYHPNLFLDKKLRKLINNKQAEHRKKMTASTVRKRKTKIGRNDPCICGSGKKYKKCCLIK